VYIVQALAHLAGTKGNPLVASRLVAEARGFPERFLLKLLKPVAAAGLLHSLRSVVALKTGLLLKPVAAAGLLHSVRGPNGGSRLARPAKQITLLEIVEAVDGPLRGQVPDVAAADSKALGDRPTAVCDAAADLTRKRLAKVRLADLG
jgi:DNA-binding IscR family transcriptional regulator